MNFKSVVYYLSIAGIVFALSFAYLQSLQMGFENNNMILTVNGKNLGGIQAAFSNRFVKDITLDTTGLKNHSNSTVRFNIPDFAYIRNLQLTFESDSGFELHRIVFSGNNRTVTIKKNDFKHLFHVQYYTYNPGTSTFIKDDNVLEPPNKLIINSINLSGLLNSTYIKRVSIYWNIIISILFSVTFVLLYHFMLVKTNKISKNKLWLGILIVLLTFSSIQKIFYSTDVNEKLMENYYINVFKSGIQNNLVYNGDFKHGLIFWGYNSDSTNHELINTPFGKGVKISRGDGSGGFWSLIYLGRRILYHQNHTYHIKFKYKTLKGNDIPFQIGWWVKIDGHAVAQNLKIKSTQINDNWFDAEAQYTFLQNIKNPTCFLSSLKDYSEVCIADVQIYDLNREENQIDFVDQDENNTFLNVGK